MTRFRRRSLNQGEEVASAVTAVALGAGVATVAYYALRLFLSREPLSGARPPPDGVRALSPAEEDEGRAASVAGSSGAKLDRAG